ncbi:protein of unknown function DUF395 YeeE/YedE [Anaeromyxobacter dehalogenans 2CP-1]|uniref:Uncharacterized protein n=1 Tax=Anaeromyxobacter dehalogenans (strain ATCC BAA-258 / DSM 21875 / 2CP-1) TaxID=455488 RepID=B8JE82_ANAD2|nr:YeeE/YedE thiosulfate transporter family protein [Anaeromyxobacter dehalogenans]ACL66147.1 protein of unknown function DUF395 YeeE/YedE [Anaeromyxobacter dehalogenans 2CP-1]
MEGPLSVVLRFSHPVEMIVSVLVGMGFGFALERAGFGTARNLAAVFYGRDFRVLRVMFTAIVTAMVGVYFLDLAGVVPLSTLGILDTFPAAQAVGGLLVGAGFIVGGYCPGTSLVGAVSGKLDALLFIGGLLVGTLVYTLGADTFAPLADAGGRGRVLLHEWLRLPSGVVVFAVALLAVGAFWAVGRIERWVNRRAAPAGQGPQSVPSGAAAAERRAP